MYCLHPHPIAEWITTHPHSYSTSLQALKHPHLLIAPQFNVCTGFQHLRFTVYLRATFFRISMSICFCAIRSHVGNPIILASSSYTTTSSRPSLNDWHAGVLWHRWWSSEISCVVIPVPVFELWVGWVISLCKWHSECVREGWRFSRFALEHNVLLLLLLLLLFNIIELISCSFSSSDGVLGLSAGGPVSLPLLVSKRSFLLVVRNVQRQYLTRVKFTRLPSHFNAERGKALGTCQKTLDKVLNHLRSTNDCVDELLNIWLWNNRVSFSSH